jgi:hypothetical protein
MCQVAAASRRKPSLTCDNAVAGPVPLKAVAPRQVVPCPMSHLPPPVCVGGRQRTSLESRGRPLSHLAVERVQFASSLRQQGPRVG